MIDALKALSSHCLDAVFPVCSVVLCQALACTVTSPWRWVALLPVPWCCFLRWCQGQCSSQCSSMAQPAGLTLFEHRCIQCSKCQMKLPRAILPCLSWPSLPLPPVAKHQWLSAVGAAHWLREMDKFVKFYPGNNSGRGEKKKKRRKKKKKRGKSDRSNWRKI